MLVGLVEDPLHKLGCCTVSAACTGKSSAVLVYCDKTHVSWTRQLYAIVCTVTALCFSLTNQWACLDLIVAYLLWTSLLSATVIRIKHVSHLKCLCCLSLF